MTRFTAYFSSLYTVIWTNVLPALSMKRSEIRHSSSAILQKARNYAHLFPAVLMDSLLEGRVYSQAELQANEELNCRTPWFTPSSEKIANHASVNRSSPGCPDINPRHRCIRWRTDLRPDYVRYSTIVESRGATLTCWSDSLFAGPRKFITDH